MPSERSPAASTIYGSRTTRKSDLFNKKEKYGGGNLKNESKDGFSGGTSAGDGAKLQLFYSK